MISNGSTVKIAYCKKLQELNLVFLVGQTAVITETRFKNIKTPGAFVIITKGVNKGEEWFVPLRSLQTKETINRLRSADVLKRLITTNI